MKFKKLFGAVLLGLFLTVAIQSKAQVEVGIRAGVNFSNVVIKDNDGKSVDGTKLLPGFNAGLTFDIPIADEFYIQPGALFSTKGSKITGAANEDFFGTEASKDDYFKLNGYYLEVPVNFLYKPALGNGNMLLGVGPYVAYGLGGRYKDVYAGESNKGKVEFINDYDDQSADENKVTYGKPFDFGGNLLVGYEFANRFSAQLNAQLGLANLEPKDSGEKPESKFKNVGFGVSLGYKF